MFNLIKSGFISVKEIYKTIYKRWAIVPNHTDHTSKVPIKIKLTQSGPIKRNKSSQSHPPKQPQLSPIINGLADIIIVIKGTINQIFVSRALFPKTVSFCPLVDNPLLRIFPINI